MAEQITYSVVVPVFNEREVLSDLYKRMTSVMDKLGEPYEIIFVNDGSNDGSLELMKTLHSQDNRVKIINFSRNFGHQIAISAGLDHSSGKAVIVMDADLQDPPEILPQFVQKWKEGFDVVYGVRRRKGNLFKRISYKLFYKILSRISNIYIPEESGDFSLLSRRVVEAIKSAKERNRFIRGIRSWVGFNQIGVEYGRPVRLGGEAKYTLRKLIKLALDGFFAFSWVPLRLSTYAGLFISGISFLLIIYALYAKFIMKIPLVGWASIFVAVLFIGGIQLIMIGIVGEYIARIYEEVKRRPLYFIKEIIE